MSRKEGRIETRTDPHKGRRPCIEFKLSLEGAKRVCHRDNQALYEGEQLVASVRADQSLERCKISAGSSFPADERLSLRFMRHGLGCGPTAKSVEDADIKLTVILHSCIEISSPKDARRLSMASDSCVVAPRSSSDARLRCRPGCRLHTVNERGVPVNTG